MMPKCIQSEKRRKTTAERVAPKHGNSMRGGRGFREKKRKNSEATQRAGRASTLDSSREILNKPIQLSNSKVLREGYRREANRESGHREETRQQNNEALERQH